MTDKDRISEIHARLEAAEKAEGFAFDAISQLKLELLKDGYSKEFADMAIGAFEDIPYLLSQLAEAKRSCEDCDIARRDFALSQTVEYVDRAIMLDKINDLISQLTAKTEEIEQLRDILYDGEGVNLVNYWYQQCQIAENAIRNYSAELAALKEKGTHL